MGHLAIIVLFQVIISMHFVPSAAYAPAPAPRPQPKVGAVLPAPQPASSARIKSTAGLPLTAATSRRVPSTTTAVPTAVPAVSTAQPVLTPLPTTTAAVATTPGKAAAAAPAPITTTAEPTTTPAPTTTTAVPTTTTSAPIVLPAQPLLTPAPLAACCATYPENEAEIESIVVAETNAEGCSVLAGSSYYYEYAGSCLIPLRATCEAVEEEGFEQLGSVVPCSAATTKTADNIIDAEAEAEAEAEGSPAPPAPTSNCSECSLQCTALCGAGASAPYVAACASCASGNGGFCVCT